MIIEYIRCWTTKLVLGLIIVEENSSLVECESRKVQFQPPKTITHTIGRPPLALNGQNGTDLADLRLSLSKLEPGTWLRRPTFNPGLPSPGQL